MLKARDSFASAKGCKTERFDNRMSVRLDFHLGGKGREDLICPHGVQTCVIRNEGRGLSGNTIQVHYVV